MPDELEAYLPRHNIVSRAIEDYNRRYKKTCFQTMWRTIVDLKTRRDPRSGRWHSELPIFVSGGGSSMSFYQSTIDELSGKARAFYHGFEGLRPRSLTKPDNFVADVDERTYHRLAVAWGLSFEETDIGHVTRPGEIEDIEPPETFDWRAGFISKDMV